MKQVAIVISVLSFILFLAATDYAAFDYAHHVSIGGVLAAIAANLAVVALVLIAYLDIKDD